MNKQTAIDWLEDQLKDNLKTIVLKQDYQLMEYLFTEARRMEQEQMGYTKEDVLKAGEIGEINHYDYKHIVKLLDEAREINRKEIKLKQ